MNFTNDFRIHCTLGLFLLPFGLPTFLLMTFGRSSIPNSMKTSSCLLVSFFGLHSEAGESLIMDIDRFSSTSQFTASFGVVPKQKESADTSHHCSTTHRGDEVMRRLLKQAAWVHVNNCPDSVVAEMYRRMKAKGKPHNEILIACARKLLTVVRSVLINDRPFTTDVRLLERACEMCDSEDVLSG